MDEQELNEWAQSLDPHTIAAYSPRQDLAPKERKFLYDISRRLRRGDHLSFRQLHYLRSVIEKIATIDRMEHRTEQDLVKAAKSGGSSIVRHLVVRLAWHDNGWNGRICEDPATNVFCVGEHSLLSDRIRTRRDLVIETRADCRDAIPSKTVLGDYNPPCFWSINAFSPRPLSVIHDNPAAKDFPPIPEEIPPYSVFSWPFKLSFVRDKKEEKQYGKYYPPALFESRIQKFQNHLHEKQSIVFLYCNFSNPISGEDNKFLLVGCAFLQEKGASQRFKPTPVQLKAMQSKRGMANFPTLNWALRYSMDIENSGVRLPYHEYLKQIRRPGGLSGELLDEIKVTITEPELIDGFRYVAKHVDDDQAIYLLMKLRKSILAVMEHGLEIGYDADSNLRRTDDLLAYVWAKRGYLPGFKSLTHAVLGLAPADTRGPETVAGAFQLSDGKSIERLRDCLMAPNSIAPELAPCEATLCELAERFETLGITPEDFLRLAALNLTRIQFERILRKERLSPSLKELCDNPYLIYEEYQPGEALEDLLSGDKIDGPIDLYKIDIALFPHARFLKRVPILHRIKVSDQRRLRAVSIEALEASKKDDGHCFAEARDLQDSIRQYPLFYHFELDYEVNVDFRDLPAPCLAHFQEKLVARREDSRVYYYLKSVFDAEQYVANQIQTLIRAEGLPTSLPDLVDDLTKSADRLSKTIGSRFEREQFIKERTNLYNKLPEKRFFVISGVPGSGKSYELLKIVSRLDQEGEASLILTLTGKAALRLKNNEEGFTGIKAKTIDKFLAECRQMGSARRVIPNLIIDEMSMVDLEKIAEILKRINIESPYFKRLILVGDENQLPPIGAGKVFEDILEYMRSGDASLREQWVHLDVNCRTQMSAEFLSFCRIFSNNKNYERWLSQVDTTDELCSGLTIRRWHTHEELQCQLTSRFLEMFDGTGGKGNREETLDRILGIGPKAASSQSTLDRFQILSPYKTGLAGASGMNYFFQETFRSDEAFSGGKNGEIAFKVKDKVIHTQNEYEEDDLFVSNGSLGIVTGFKQLRFVEHEQPISLARLRHPQALELAYAITVHKAQGNGFSHVFIILPERYGLLNRELLFTALTRAKESVTLFIQVGQGKHDASRLLDRIRKKSAVETRRTSLLKEQGIGYAYIPSGQVSVKSRVEYIIYKKLEDRQAQFGGFDFQYEETYPLHDKPFDIHPDFTIHLPGKVIYWEHLGKLTSPSYLRDWDDRRKLYEAKGDLDKVLTTHELHGISDSKIAGIIEALLDGTLQSEDSSDRYSQCHCSLR